MNIYHLESAAIFLDNACDYIPLMSTLTNLTDLFIKKVCIPKDREIGFNKYFTHLTDKSRTRSIVLLFPFVGNLAVAIYDLCTLKFKNKKFTLEALKNNPNPLNLKSNSLFTTIYYIFKVCTYPLNFTSHEMRRDKAFMMECMNHSPMAPLFGEGSLYSDPEFALTALKTRSDIFKAFNPSLWSDPTVMLAAVELDIGALLLVMSTELVHNVEFMRAVFKQHGPTIFKLLDEVKKYPVMNQAKLPESYFENVYQYRSNKGMMIEALIHEPKRFWDENLTGVVLEYVTDNVKDSYAFMQAAASIHTGHLVFASERLKRNKDFLLHMMRNGHDIFAIDPQFYDDSDDRGGRIKIPPGFPEDKFYIVDPSLLSDREFILEAIKINGLILEHIPKENINLDIACEAICQNIEAWEFVPEELLDDLKGIDKAGQMFALSVLINDGYINIKETADSKVARFLKIIKQLPMELQQVLALRDRGLIRDVIPPSIVESSFKHIAKNLNQFTPQDSVDPEDLTTSSAEDVASLSYDTVDGFLLS